MQAPTLQGVVLAAGLSSRMGALKPLLPVGGLPAVVRSSRAFTDIGVEPLVVLGYQAARIGRVLDEAGVRHVTNHAYERGMYSSVVKGVGGAPGDVDYVAVLPVDLPLVRAETVGRLVRAAARRRPAVVYPRHGGRRGHPPLLAADVRAVVLGADAPGGLREVLARFEARALDVDVDDEGVTIDMDDRDGHALVDGLAHREEVPDAAVCRRLLTTHRTPAVVRGHCTAVAEVAGALGRALNQVGACLHLGLLDAAARLHDIARERPDHANAGATCLVAAGYPRVAAAVAHHMDAPEPLPSIPGEAEVLYLADKLVRDATVVPLERRLADTLEHLAGDAAACGAARRRFRAAMRVAAEVERLTGRPVDRLVA